MKIINCKNCKLNLKHYAKALCLNCYSKCYKRSRYIKKQRKIFPVKCKIIDCDNKYFAKNYCSQHYYQIINKEYYNKNKKRSIKRRIDYQKLHPEQARKAHKKWRDANPEKARLATKNWGKRNTGKIRLYKSRRYMALEQAKPKWVLKEESDLIFQMYENKPSGFEVDHIIPLQGNTVKGLHVIKNLQYLPANINTSKGNKIPKINILLSLEIKKFNIKVWKTGNIYLGF